MIAFVDNDKSKWGKKLLDIPIYNPEKCIKEMTFDYYFGSGNEFNKRTMSANGN